MLHKRLPVVGLAVLAGLGFLFAASAAAQVPRIPRTPDSRGVLRVPPGYNGPFYTNNFGSPYDPYAGAYYNPGAFAPYNSSASYYNGPGTAFTYNPTVGSYAPGVGVPYTPSLGSQPFATPALSSPGLYAGPAYALETFRSNVLPIGGTVSGAGDSTTDTGRTATAPLGPVAYLDVRVPENAVLYAQGVRTKQGGERRQFVSPPLAAAREYTYDLRATWTENGKEVVRDKQVRVRAGARLDVDLLTAGEASTSTPQTKPQP